MYNLLIDTCFIILKLTTVVTLCLSLCKFILRKRKNKSIKGLYTTILVCLFELFILLQNENTDLLIKKSDKAKKKQHWLDILNDASLLKGYI